MQMQINKVTTVPALASVNDNSLYFSVDSENVDLMNLSLVSSDSALMRSLISETSVTTDITTALGQDQHMYIAADMDALETLNDSLTVAAGNASPANHLVWVIAPQVGLDPDSSVITGSATYLWDTNGQAYTKVFEAESMDLVFDWADVINTPVMPTSTAAEIDQMVTNINLLQTNVANLFTASESAGGDIIYNGSTLSNAGNVILGSTAW